jgi:hypothetical protein
LVPRPFNELSGVLRGGDGGRRHSDARATDYFE